MALSASPGKRYGVEARMRLASSSQTVAATGYASTIRVATERSVGLIAKELAKSSGVRAVRGLLACPIVVTVDFRIVERPAKRKHDGDPVAKLPASEPSPHTVGALRRAETLADVNERAKVR